MATTIDRDHDLETLFRIYQKCKRKSYYKNGRPRPRRSQRCPCEACRRKYAEKEACVLLRSFKDNPPTHAFVLKLVDGEPTVDVQMGRYLHTFTQYIRDYRKSTGVAIDYEIRLEFKDGVPHVHGIFISPLGWSREEVKKLVKGWWEASCPGRSTLAYADQVRTVIGIAKYNVKDLKDRRGVEMPPMQWNGRKCRFVRRSKYFLSKTKKELWREQCEEWYPPQEEVDVENCEIEEDETAVEDARESPSERPRRGEPSTGQPTPLRANLGHPVLHRSARSGFWLIWRGRESPMTRGP